MLRLRAFSALQPSAKAYINTFKMFSSEQSPRDPFKAEKPVRSEEATKENLKRTEDMLKDIMQKAEEEKNVAKPYQYNAK
jgi:hypothetical protein